jgi:DNA-binding NarL/FixJ family response regulator
MSYPKSAMRRGGLGKAATPRIHRLVYGRNVGVKRVGVPVPWTPEEEAVLRQGLAEGKSYSKIALALRKGEKTVQRHAWALGLKSQHQSRTDKQAYWTGERQDLLKALIRAGKTWAEITKVLDRSESNCRSWARRIGARMTFDPVKQATNGRPWAAEEDAQLIAMVMQRLPHSEIAPKLGRTVKATMARMGVLNKGVGWKKYYQQKPAAQSLAKMRRCLGHVCGGKEFHSRGPGHRLCERCRGSNQLYHTGHV